MKCINCKNMDLRVHPRHANMGLGLCKAQEFYGAFVSINRDMECDMFERVDGGAMIKRQAWADRVNQSKKEQS